MPCLECAVQTQRSARAHGCSGMCAVDVPGLRLIRTRARGCSLLASTSDYSLTVFERKWSSGVAWVPCFEARGWAGW